jgi:hypothetical protein
LKSSAPESASAEPNRRASLGGPGNRAALQLCIRLIVPRSRSAVFRSDYVAPDFGFTSGGGTNSRDQSGHEVDGRWLDGSAAFAAQAPEKIFKGHIALTSDQQAHGVENRTAPAMQAMQLDYALRPVREPVLFTKKGRMHPAILDGNTKRTRAKLRITPATSGGNASFLDRHYGQSEWRPKRRSASKGPTRFPSVLVLAVGVSQPEYP